jgi:hypothetical protein
VPPQLVHVPAGGLGDGVTGATLGAISDAPVIEYTHPSTNASGNSTDGADWLPHPAKIKTSINAVRFIGR